MVVRELQYVFGPVPSRRLGRSLGVNNIPPKICTYSCIYCQIGKTITFEVIRREFFKPQEIVNAVANIIGKQDVGIDYITFVPDGEPTLDINLGKTARMLKKITDIPLAILTNSSLIHRRDVRDDLNVFDVVSLKIDAVTEKIWRVINRPHPQLVLGKILDGILEFQKSYNGRILTETMLVKNVNDSNEELCKIAEFISQTNVDKAYVAIPIRPPAEKWVEPPLEEKVAMAYNCFVEYLGKNHVELLIGYEGPDFRLIGDPIQALLATVCVHPMRIDYAFEYLRKHNLDPEKVINELVSKNKIRVIEYGETKFIIRKFSMQPN